ncbi:MAG: hypothetical protein ACI4MI_05405 [Christensenellales bacterium]
MGKHTIFGFSTVASSWREAYRTSNIGDDFNKVIGIAGEADEILSLGEIVLYTYISEEWKGFLRGGTIVRKMQFAVKNGKIVSKTEQNLNKSMV